MHQDLVVRTLFFGGGLRGGASGAMERAGSHALLPPRWVGKRNGADVDIVVTPHFLDKLCPLSRKYAGAMPGEEHQALKKVVL